VLCRDGEAGVENNKCKNKKRTIEKLGKHSGADKQNRGISTVQTKMTNTFSFRKCGITTNHNILGKSQAKLCVNMGKLNITKPPPPHSTIKQVTLQIPKERANHKNKSHSCND
jgi:hypothetical protein